MFPHLRGIDVVARRHASETANEIRAFEPDDIAACADVAFCALPHGHSAPAVAALRARGVRVVDLSADFRLRSADDYATWYGTANCPAHPAPALLGEAVYGLPERYRHEIATADLVAAPGCYPTGALLALVPLLARGLISSAGLIVDAKSGASGAGRSASAATHLPEIVDGVRAYKVAGTHRHTCEIEQELSAAAGAGVRLLFTPHLLPVSRGILTCAYASATEPDREPDTYRDALADAYRDEPFVDVLPPGRLPDTSHVRGSNRAHVTAVYDPRSRRVLAISAIDNLLKGASGQAVQCMNAMLGMNETTGLQQVPVFP